MNKFHNIPTIYNGVKYHSKKEAEFAKELDLRKKAGDILDWNRQVSIEILVYEKPVCKYIMDFTIIHKNNQKEWVECKGMKTEAWKLKWKLLQITRPDLWLTLKD